MQESNDVANEALSLMKEQGMLLEKEADNGTYLEPQANQFTPES